MKKSLYLLLSLLLLLTGCRSTKQTVASGAASGVTTTTDTQNAKYLSAKLQMTVPTSGSSITCSGTLKLKKNEIIQMSVLMPIFRTEMFRVETTPDYCVVVDRINKQWARLTTEEAASILPANFEYSKLESLLITQAAASSRYELSGKDMGLPSSFEKAKVVVYDISDSSFDIEATTSMGGKYTQVSADQLIKSLKSLSSSL